jgi:hypothetical protein
MRAFSSSSFCFAFSAYSSLFHSRRNWTFVAFGAADMVAEGKDVRVLRPIAGSHPTYVSSSIPSMLLCSSAL